MTTLLTICQHQCQDTADHMQADILSISTYQTCMILRVREIREEKGWTIDQLSEMTGIDRGHLSAIEREKKNINNRTISLLSKALKVPPSHLFVSGISPTKQQLIDLVLSLPEDGLESAENYLGFLNQGSQADK